VEGPRPTTTFCKVGLNASRRLLVLQNSAHEILNSDFVTFCLDHGLAEARVRPTDGCGKEVALDTNSIDSFDQPIAPLREFPLKGILWGGLVAGLLDGLDAVIYFGIASGATPDRIFRYIAGGLIGLESARAAGWGVVALGIALHFSIATGAAAAYGMASLWMPQIVRRPFLWGPIFGIAVYVFMDFLVLPLSKLPHQGHWSSTSVFVNEMFIHMLGVGLPIAWFASRHSRMQRDKFRDMPRPSIR
jgi:hypothetical protein